MLCDLPAGGVRELQVCRWLPLVHERAKPQTTFHEVEKRYSFRGAVRHPKVHVQSLSQGLPSGALRTKAVEYVAAGLMTFEMAKQVCKLIEEERGFKRILNERPAGDAYPENAEGDEEGNVSSRLSAAALKKELSLIHI